MGAATFTYPKEAGLAFGGPDYNPYIRIEVHYNNPDEVGGTIDSSGMRIKFVEKLRKYDAAVMELGLEYTDKMAIPPGQLAFPLSGYCIAECTKVALPKAGITVFGSQLHTHLRGVRGEDDLQAFSISRHIMTLISFAFPQSSRATSAKERNYLSSTEMTSITTASKKSDTCDKSQRCCRETL